MSIAPTEIQSCKPRLPSQAYSYFFVFNPRHESATLNPDDFRSQSIPRRYLKVIQGKERAIPQPLTSNFAAIARSAMPISTSKIVKIPMPSKNLSDKSMKSHARVCISEFAFFFLHLLGVVSVIVALH